MKTLVIQLARFGDIYQSWPSLFSLASDEKREVHLMVRKKFIEATVGLPKNITVKELDTKDLLEPLFMSNEGELESFKILDQWVNDLVEENYDEVINLTFSPFSSYLTSLIEMQGAKASGYTRHSDGFLNMPDDTSAYFYAQGGVGKPNQIHLVDLFSMMAGVEIDEGHKYPKVFYGEELFDIGNEYFVVHVGASDRGKSLDGKQLNELVRTLLAKRTESLVFIGAENERGLADAALPLLGSERVYNLVGKTKLRDLFSVISRAKAFFGVDSAPLQIASLLDRPICNFTCSSVNFYESGPFSKNHLVLDIQEDFSSLASFLEVEFSNLLSGKNYVFVPTCSELMSEQWSLMKALYMGNSGYPKKILHLTAQNLFHLQSILPEVYRASENPATNQNAEVLRKFDIELQLIEKSDPLLGIVIRWFNAERVRIGPGPFEEIKEKTLVSLNNLFLIISDWVRVLSEGVSFISENSSRLEMVDEAVKNFRFVNVKEALTLLEQILPQLTAISSTEVLRSQFQEAIHGSDFEKAADLLEYKLKPLLLSEDMLMCEGGFTQSL